jgi:hypothetical protein
MPDRDEGFVQVHRGWQPKNIKLAKAYTEAAAWPAASFNSEDQRFLIETVLDVCGRRSWRLHAAATEPTHLHAVVSWRDQTKRELVQGKIRNIVSTELSKRFGEKGRPWLATGSSRRRVKNDEHLSYLINEYLPGHSGWKWFEGRGFVK